jgi:hypothetical protein
MKIITITTSVVGLLVFLFVADVYYLHLFSQYFIRFSEHPKLFSWSLNQFEHPKFIAILFWVGFLLTFLSVLLAGLSLRDHWRSGTFIGRFCWCFALLASYIGLFVFLLNVSSQTVVNISQIFQQDPIDNIVKEGCAAKIFPPPTDTFTIFPIKLTASAPIAEVVSEAFLKGGGGETNVTILETRRVHIANVDKDRKEPKQYNDYTAVLVNTSLGRKVVLLHFYPQVGEWDYLFYDLPPTA